MAISSFFLRWNLPTRPCSQLHDCPQLAVITTHFEPSKFYLGYVWVGLILLKLKIFCWNHCSKIIFKCVNSIVRPIFNEKIDKKWNLWVHEQYTDALFTEKSQHLRLLFMYCSLNSSRIPSEMREKKKKKKTKRMKTQLQ